MSTLEDLALELKRSGNRLWAKRDYPTARSTFLDLIRIAPHTPDGYVGLAKVNYVLHEHAHTVSVLLPMAESLNHFGVWRGLADALRALIAGREHSSLPEAIAAHQRALALQPDTVLYFHLGELLAFASRHAEAVSAFQQSLARDPQSPSVQAALTHSLKQLSSDQGTAGTRGPENAA